ncbi:MAG: tubulin-like doman-containing protein [Pseudomonadota bacterium]|nr:tubulin-like doman-containing protein [Pseudomonadota bacterium]
MSVLNAVVTGDDNEYQKKLNDFVEQKGHGKYARTVFVGLGGSGAKSLLHLRRLVMERFGKAGALPGIAYLSIDTDTSSSEPPPTQGKRDLFEDEIRFGAEERVNLTANFSSLIGENLSRNPHIREWWDASYAIPAGLRIEQGAGQIRPLARLTWFSNREAIIAKLTAAHRKVTSAEVVSERVDLDAGVRFVIVAGWGGGTGAGTFLDTAALIRASFGAVSVDGIFILAGVFRAVEGAFAKVAANSHACLTEINHHLTHPFTVRWTGTDLDTRVKGLFDRYVLFSGTNAAGQTLAKDDDCYRSIGEALFLDFSAGKMSAWIRGVQVNRKQYLSSYVTYPYHVETPEGEKQELNGERWYTAFSSFGISKLVFPSWRLLNLAKYDLAAEMVATLDPSLSQGPGGVTPQRLRQFMMEAGFFQGESEADDGQKKSHRQVRERLFRLTGDGNITSIPDELAARSRALVDDAERLFTEKVTREACDIHRRDAEKRIGDPNSPGSEGEWVRQLAANRVAYLRELDAALPGLIETYRRKPGMGPTGVVRLFDDVLTTMSRPKEQEKYADWFRAQKAELIREAAEAAAAWEKQVLNAERAGSGFFPSLGNHQAAIARAAESLRAHFDARVKILLVDEAVKLLDGVATRLSQARTEVETLCMDLATIGAELRNYREHYAHAQSSTLFVELDTPGGWQDPIIEYIGTGETRAKRVGALRERALRSLGLDTLAQIRAQLQSNRAVFRDALANTAFHALKGEKGETTAFSEDGEPPKKGFIERFSVLNHLAEQVKDPARLQKLLEDLYKRGLPWLSTDANATALTSYRPKTDAFVGFVKGGYGELGTRIEKHLNGMQMGGFAPQHVDVQDPSEIILYTETSAFPAFYIGEVHGNSGTRQRYEEILYGRTFEPLHIHQDFHEYQAIVPLQQHEVEGHKGAMKAFLKGLMFGILRSVRLRNWDSTRVAYQYRRAESDFEVKWTDLGPEGTVLRKLRGNHDRLLSNLQAHIDDHQRRFLASGGTWAQLVALADYYYHCVFAARREGEISTTGSDGTQASIQNVICAEIARDWRVDLARARQTSRDVAEAIATMDVWATPISRAAGGIVPSTSALRREERMNDWALLGKVGQAIDRMVATGRLPEHRSAQGHVEQVFPRLAVDWEQLATVSVEPEANAVYRYRGPVGPARHGLSVADVAALVRQAPAGAHHVLGDGMTAWGPAESVPAIAALLGGGAGSPPAPVPVAAAVPAPVLPAATSVPATTDVLAWHYKRDALRLGVCGPAQIADGVIAAPEARHRVYYGTSWIDAKEVPEVAALLPAEPPPDDDEQGPPPDDDE